MLCPLLALWDIVVIGYLLIDMAKMTGCHPDCSTSVIGGLLWTMDSQSGISDRKNPHTMGDRYHISGDEKHFWDVSETFFYSSADIVLNLHPVCYISWNPWCPRLASQSFFLQSELPSSGHQENYLIDLMVKITAFGKTFLLTACSACQKQNVMV